MVSLILTAVSQHECVKQNTVQECEIYNKNVRLIVSEPSLVSLFFFLRTLFTYTKINWICKPHKKCNSIEWMSVGD